MFQDPAATCAYSEFSHLDDKSTISFVISLGNDGMDAKKLQANLDAARAKNAAKQPKKKKAGQESDEDQVERAPKVEECKLKSCKDFNELLEQREEKVMAERQVLTDSIVKISKELAALEERAMEVERTNAVLEERSNAMHEEIRQTKEEFERMEKAQVTAKHSKHRNGAQYNDVGTPAPETPLLNSPGTNRNDQSSLG
eukprot:FR742016.1.p1 GENE.FR742016.1~~FR742016.1.p1  ORF type:complete len:199 (+),score=35.19 FR742016.1:51-647(+)